MNSLNLEDLNIFDRKQSEMKNIFQKKSTNTHFIQVRNCVLKHSDQLENDFGTPWVRHQHFTTKLNFVTGKVGSQHRRNNRNLVTEWSIHKWFSIGRYHHWIEFDSFCSHHQKSLTLKIYMFNYGWFDCNFSA